MKIYEDNASGKLSDERVDMMSQSYDAEQKHLEEEARSIQQEIEGVSTRHGGCAA